ncbi:MAG: hypothetical protein HYV08_01250 [Deltaproteobacteria bacterium]|nr:hypothetical protein [Deltaproteobacteria bacterium]
MINLNGQWAGLLCGDRRGQVLARIFQRGSRVNGEIDFADGLPGFSRVRFSGKLSGNILAARLHHFEAPSEGSDSAPRRGNFLAEVSLDSYRLDGNWSTSTGAAGDVVLVKRL